MRLHGAAGLGELPGEGCLQRRTIQAEDAAGGGDRPEAAGGRWAEEAKAGARGQAEARGDVGANGDGRDQCASVDAAASLRGGERRGQHTRQSVHYRGFVQAVELLVVHLPGVQECGGGSRQAVRAAPDLGFRLIAPAGCDGQQAFRAGNGRAGDANADTVEDEDFRCPHRLG